MQIKKEQITLAVIILALILYLSLRKQDRTHYQLPELPAVAGEELTKIEILKKDSSIVLKKKDGKWHIDPQGYLVNNHNSKNILDIMEKLNLTTLVSESKDYNRYDLVEDRKITVKAWSGDTLRREIEIGKVTSSFRNTFVKVADDFRVYHASKDLRDQFDKSVDEFRDKAILAFKQNEIQEIGIKKGSQSALFTLKQFPIDNSAEKKDEKKGEKTAETTTVWENANGEEMDKAAMDKLLSMLSDLRCREYLYDRTKEELADPICTVTIKGVKEYVLSIFAKEKEDDETYPGISSENDHPFMLIGWQADTIMKDPAEMLKK
ncbi:MAG: DUF4340 domain-containing protein [Deltaproteobacteria bacterium]|nr:DUF4340 domain-containing protein [Deltaproteobacteria bacterium]